MPDLKQAVADMYAAFARGDVPAILERCAPDVVWEDWADNSAQKAGVALMTRRLGRAGAGDFFQLLATFEFRQFDVRDILVGKNQVAGEVELELKLPNGTVVREQEMHLFTFNENGQVVRFRHYLDTAKAIAAFR